MALLLPSLAAGCAAFLLKPGTGTLGQLIEAIVISTIFGGFVTVPATLLIGAPLLRLYCKLGWQRWWQYVVGGLVAGLIVVGFLFFFYGGSEFHAADFFSSRMLFASESLLLASCGGLSALGLWLALFASRRVFLRTAALLFLSVFALGVLG